MEILPILISYAASLSGYPATDVSLAYVPHSFFVEHVCGGKECNVLGAYLDGDSPAFVYVDMRYENESTPFVSSLIVHELTHALQWHSGEFDSQNCEDSLLRERQAYYVQNEYLIQNGHFPVLRSAHGVCAKGSSDDK